MNKEEILAKSKAENVYGDEYEKKIRKHRDASFGWGTTAFLYEAVQMKKKYLMVVSIVL